ATGHCGRTSPRPHGGTRANRTLRSRRRRRSTGWTPSDRSVDSARVSRRRDPVHTRRLTTLLAAPALLAGLAVSAVPATAAPPPQDAEVSDLQVVPSLKEWHGDDGTDFTLGGHVVLPRD